MQHFQQSPQHAHYVDERVGTMNTTLTQTPTLNRQFHLVAKRLIDIAGSGLGLIFLAPFFAIAAILIKLDSPGPVFFGQDRWGKDGKRIRIYKFRSMHADQGDATGLKQTIENDPRVTRVGAFLRRTSFDELPQLVSVLKGDMSLVGPRAHAIGMKGGDVLYEELVPDYHNRHAVRPGITGLAQVQGYRGPTTDPVKAAARIRYDLEYIETFTIWKDIGILLRTVVNELRGGTGF